MKNKELPFGRKSLQCQEIMNIQIDEGIWTIIKSKCQQPINVQLDTVRGEMLKWF